MRTPQEAPPRAARSHDHANGELVDLPFLEPPSASSAVLSLDIELTNRSPIVANHMRLLSTALIRL